MELLLNVETYLSSASEIYFQHDDVFRLLVMFDESKSAQFEVKEGYLYFVDLFTDREIVLVIKEPEMGDGTPLFTEHRLSIKRRLTL